MRPEEITKGLHKGGRERSPWLEPHDIATFRSWEIRRNTQVRLKKSGQ